MPRVVISVRVSEQTAAAIDKARGGTSRARWAEDVIGAALDRDEPMGAAAATPRAEAAPRAGGCDHPRARVIKGFCYKCGSMMVPK